MRKYLAVIVPLAIFTPVFLIMLWSVVMPPRQQAPAEAMSPSVAESYRQDGLRHEEFQRKQAKDERDRTILKKALERCEATKIGDAAVLRCVARETQ